MFRCIIFCFAFILVTIYGQNNCQNEIDAFYACIEKHANEQHNVMEQNHAEREKKMKSQIQQCFSKSGCKEPNFNNSQGGNEDLENRHQCTEQVTDHAKTIVEQCVQSQQKGFHFPPKPQEKKHNNGGSFGNINKSLNDSCPEGSRQAVKSCMIDSLKNLGGGIDFSQLREIMKKNCQTRDTCFNAMSAPCQTSFNETKKIICQCAQKLDQDSLNQEFTNCTGKATQTPKSGGQGGGFGPGGSPVKSLVDRWCDKNDICHNNSQTGVGGQAPAGGNLAGPAGGKPTGKG